MPCAGGHRLAGVWEGVRSSRFWPGNFDFQVRYHLADLLFYPPKDCPQGSCVPGEKVVEPEK